MTAISQPSPDVLGPIISGVLDYRKEAVSTTNDMCLCSKCNTWRHSGCLRGKDDATAYCEHCYPAELKRDIMLVRLSHPSSCDELTELKLLGLLEASETPVTEVAEFLHSCPGGREWIEGLDSSYFGWPSIVSCVVRVCSTRTFIKHISHIVDTHRRGDSGDGGESAAATAEILCPHDEGCVCALPEHLSNTSLTLSIHTDVVMVLEVLHQL